MREPELLRQDSSWYGRLGEMLVVEALPNPVGARSGWSTTQVARWTSWWGESTPSSKVATTGRSVSCSTRTTWPATAGHRGRGTGLARWLLARRWLGGKERRRRPQWICSSSSRIAAARDVRTNEHRPGAPRGRRDHGQERTSQGGNSRGHVEPGQVFGLRPGRVYGGGWWHGNGLCGWDRTRWSRSNCPGGGPAPSTWQKIPG